MRLHTSLDSGFALATWPGVAGTNANASPQGPATAAEAGFGVSAGSGGKNVSGHTIGVLSTSTIALALLIWIWWALPK
jgi:hypothetical protein